MARLDPHSYNDSTQPETETLDWRARVDFKTQRLHAEVTHTLKEASAGPLDLDTRDLEIRDVVDAAGRPLPYILSPSEPILGSRLRIELPVGLRQFTVRYRTAPHASALQWLTPSQTAGGKHPFLYSQCQAIHARSVVPLQDTPRIRIRYTASLRIPKALKAVMAASFLRREEHGVEAEEHYEMPQPVPPYLLAFAVGSRRRRSWGRARACGRSRSCWRTRRRSSPAWTTCCAPPSRSSGPMTGSASTCSPCRPRSPTAAWRTRA
ncbi:hypothetical protein QEG98_27860 [Myxococcus sp. MxC21-1]|nr:hypothetical protein QEG98_27860 [Myxococcus sp. MxC21-1]